MKISNKIVKEVIEEVAGEDVIELVQKLKNKKNVSEFKLAESIKQEINITRNMLYRLYDANLVSFTRKKDKKKGWYIYYWTFNLKRVKYLALVIKKKRLDKLKERLEREKNNQFYICPNNCIRLDFEQSMNFEFKCPECGILIEQDDNRDEINEIEKEINKLEDELKLEKVQKRKIKKQVVKKKKERVREKKSKQRITAKKIKKIDKKKILKNKIKKKIKKYAEKKKVKNSKIKMTKAGKKKPKKKIKKRR